MTAVVSFCNPLIPFVNQRTPIIRMLIMELSVVFRHHLWWILLQSTSIRREMPTKHGEVRVESDIMIRYITAMPHGHYACLQFVAIQRMFLWMVRHYFMMGSRRLPRLLEFNTTSIHAIWILDERRTLIIGYFHRYKGNKGTIRRALRNTCDLAKFFCNKDTFIRKSRA